MPFDASTWNSLIAALPDPHVLQTWQWGQIKAAYGWQPFLLAWAAGPSGQVRQVEALGPGERAVAAALVLRRSIPIGGFSARLRVLYAPKGPLLDWQDAPLRRQVLNDLQTFAKRQGAIFLKMDPDVVVGTGVPGQPEAQEPALGRAVAAELRASGWQPSDEQIQFRNTVMIDLAPEEETLLANMKQKTRYNVRLAQKKGVRVRIASKGDLPLLFRMYAETSVRDGFVIREEAYYHKLWASFLQAGLAEALIAEVEGEPVAGVVVFRFAGRAYYLNGMSRPLHREKMPTYLLQWEAMRRAKAAGCRWYDLWGAPDEFNESDSMWGVYRFKEGLGGEVVRTLGAWDLPTQPLLYRLYTQTLPRLLDLMRRRGKEQTRRRVEGG